MKLAFLFLLALAAASGQSSHEIAAQASKQASDAYWACRSHGIQADCSAERKAWAKASDADQQSIADELHANTPKFEQALAEIQQVTERIHQYAVCRRSRHWWQFWKRCRYTRRRGGRK
jgi:hypothetical protein